MRRMMHKFRFQLVHEWLIKTYRPGRVADIGGGKGLLAYLLRRSGWEAVVIDPVRQRLKHKFKDIETGKQIKLTQQEQEGEVRIDRKFEKEMAKDFDLLVGLHAHGSNMRIIEAAREYGKDFAILPCCVIDEPIEKRAGVDWIKSLVEYARSLGFKVKTEKLNFVGQNLIIYTDGYRGTAVAANGVRERN